MPSIYKPPATAAALRLRFGPFPFTLLQCEAAGVTRRQLRSAVRNGLVEHLAFDSYAVAGSEVSDRDLYLQRVSAALARRWNAAGSHESAAAALSLPNPRFTPWRSRLVVVTNPGTMTRRRRGILSVDQPRHLDSEVRTPWGPVTGLTRTAFDFAASRPLPEALVVIDAVARELHPAEDRAGYLDPSLRASVRDRLVAAAESWSDGRGQARAMKILRMAEPAAESAAESASRAHIISAGLPPAIIGARVIGADDRVYYGDFVWPDHWVIGEVDGEDKYPSRQQVIEEKEREDALRFQGWQFVRWSGKTVAASPHTFIHRLRQKLS